MRHTACTCPNPLGHSSELTSVQHRSCGRLRPSPDLQLRAPVRGALVAVLVESRDGAHEAPRIVLLTVRDLVLVVGLVLTPLELVAPLVVEADAVLHRAGSILSAEIHVSGAQARE